MTKEELDIQKEIEKYFTESTGFGRDKIKNFMDIVNKALKQKGEKIEELENKIADIKANCDLAIEGRDVKIKELEKENAELIETLKTYNGCGDWDNDFHTCRVYLQHEELQMYINQLTKAKEIIKDQKELLDRVLSGAETLSDFAQNTLRKAEQFLKEIEK